MCYVGLEFRQFPRSENPFACEQIEMAMFFFFFNLFLAALGLRCRAQAFSSCSEQGLLFVAVCWLLIAVASLVAEHGFLGMRASVVVAHGLSCSAACGIFPDQGSNLCPLHWQADS